MKEIIIPADIRRLKNLSPDISEQCLGFSLRLFTFFWVTTEKGILTQGLAIDLVTSVGKTVQKQDSRRHHGARKFCSGSMSQKCRCPQCIGCLDDECDQHRLEFLSRDRDGSGAFDAGEAF